MLLPLPRDLVLVCPEIVRRRYQGRNLLHFDQDNRLDEFPPHVVATLSQEPKALFVDLALRVQHRSPLESVALPDEEVDDVDLYRGIVSKVPHRVRRSDVGEDEVLVVPHRCRALWREVRRSVRADGRSEAELLLENKTLHVIS